MLGRLRGLDWTVKLIILITGIRGVVSAFPIPLTWDEALYVNLAHNFYYFGFIAVDPLQKIIDFARAPFLPFTIYLSFLITTPNLIVAQYVAFVLSLGALYVVYLLGKELYSVTVGKYAALALTCGCIGFIFFWGVLTEIPYALLSTLFLLCIVRAQKTPKYYVPAGVTLALCFLTRYPGILIIFVGFVYIILTKNIKKALRSPWLYLGLACVFLTIIPWLIYNYINTENYLGLFWDFFSADKYWSRNLLEFSIITPVIETILFYLESLIYAVIPLFTPVFLFPYFYIAVKNERKTATGITLIFWVVMFLVAHFLLMPKAYAGELVRYNQTSLPAFCLLTGLGLAMMLTNEFQINRKSFFKGRKKLAILLIALSLTLGFTAIYATRSDPGLTQPIGVFEYLKYTTPPWQVILTNVYPMAQQYTDRMCFWLPDFPFLIDYFAENGIVGAIFVSLFRYASPLILMHLETSPLYERELIIPYQGLPYMIVYRVR